jgi:hypothetical protein
MKRALLAFASAAVLLCSCGGGEREAAADGGTPSEIVELAYSRLLKGDYDGYLKCVESCDSIPERYRAALVNVLKQNAANERKERGGMVSAKAIGGGTNPDRSWAVVRADVAYGDSTHEEIVVQTVKVAGKWRLK